MFAESQTGPNPTRPDRFSSFGFVYMKGLPAGRDLGREDPGASGAHPLGNNAVRGGGVCVGTGQGS